MINLLERSIEIILKHQDSSGAYIASPNFPTYHYCWFRDGSFSAYAMNIAGEHESAARFHKWCAGVINTRSSVIQRSIEKAKKGIPSESKDILHTRYTLSGKDGQKDWPNYQLDGFGTWLWSLSEHIKATGNHLNSEVLAAADLVSKYISSQWKNPCYDCWEEYSDKIHPYTLATIYAGLRANQSLNDENHQQLLNDIKEFVCKEAVNDGRFVKFLGSDDVDASLIGISLPYGVVDVDHQIMVNTLRLIEEKLRRGSGGVHRYSTDTYYGGGEWVLLTAWLGWYYINTGEKEKAAQILKWVEDQANAKGELPEQIHVNLNNETYLPIWRERWGEIATPLLWSHAMYIILRSAFG
jgi:GH15 family glucan-1,4-alpha-glucosidase